MPSPLAEPSLQVPITLIDHNGTHDVVVTGPLGTPVTEVLPGAPGNWRIGMEILAGIVVDLRHQTVNRPCRAGGLAAEVVGGPDVGRQIPLGAGRHRIGRDLIEDPALSRRHVELAVAPTGVLVRDAGSTNGTTILSADGEVAVPRDQAIRWEPGQEVSAGSTRIALRQRPAAPPPSPMAGHLPFARSARNTAVPQAREFDLPQAPPSPQQPTFPTVAVWAPLALALPMAWFMHSAIWIMFGLLSPVMMAANHLEARRRGSVMGRAARARHLRLRAQVRHDVQVALEAEGQWREVAFPDLAELAAHAASCGPRLWERGPQDPDAYTLRLGIGTAVSRHILRVGGQRTPLRIPAAPITISLLDSPTLGVVGPQAGRVICGLLTQLICLHSPTFLRIVVLGDTSGWSWLRWAPHLRTKLPELDDHDAPARTVVIVPDATSQVAREVVRLSGNISVILQGSVRQDLPGEVTTIVTTGPHPTLEHQGEPEQPVQLDELGQQVAEQIARSLAPVQDVTPATGTAPLPPMVSLAEVLALDLQDLDQLAAQIAEQWSRPSAEAVLGMTADGPWTVDLRRDGPHLLVAGTTGSGKSELLRTLVTSLAIANRPDQLSFILVDYKGGAAFGSCASLPHVTGLVTDLDPAGTARVIESLSTEIKYREGLLARAGVADLAAYHRLPDQPVLPRLAIVLDEFRVLADEQPEALADLVRLATVGRSLGLHLVLATQRPAGVVTAEMNANINLRVALRVQSAAESTDVIGSPAAARLPTTIPGRALVRIGGEDATVLQVASVSGGRTTGQTVSVEPWDWEGGSTTVTHAGPTDDSRLEHLVAGVTAAAQAAKIPVVDPVWLPPLATQIEAPAVMRAETLELALGQADQPALRSQPHVAWQPLQDGHLIVAGTARSGRTGILRTLLLDGVSRFGADRLWLYAVDSGHGLADLAEFQQVGAVVTTDDDERLARLFTMLRREISERAADHGRPWIVLAIDSWEGLRTGRDDVEGLALLDDLFAILRNGPRVGVFVVVAGDRGALTGQLGSAIAHRLVLRPADPSDLTLVGLRTRDAPSPWPVGRGLLTGRLADPQPLLVQGYCPPTHLPVPPTDASSARPVPEMPAQVVLSDVEVPGCLVLGVGGEQVSNLIWDPTSAPLLVCGHPGSGRSTALRTIAHQALRDGWRVVSTLEIDGATTPQDIQQVREAVSTGPVMLVIDDADRLAAHWELCLDEALQAQHSSGGPGIVVAGTTAAMISTFSGPLVELRRQAAIVLLGPAVRSDRDLVDRPLPSRYTRHPGRGVLVHRGGTHQIQVARSEEPGTAGDLTPAEMAGDAGRQQGHQPKQTEGHQPRRHGPIG